MPHLTNSLGQAVTLGSRFGLPNLLPNLLNLNERSTNEYEDLHTFEVQTGFRLRFYSNFSPRAFSSPAAPDRLVQASVFRFPPSLLSHTRSLSARNLLEVLILFPLEMVSISQQARSVTSIHRPTSQSIDTIYCLNEDFVYEYYDDEYQTYLWTSLQHLVWRFPNLKHLHLPTKDSFFLYLTTELRGTASMALYDEAVSSLSKHPDVKVRAVQVHLDQTAYLP